MTFDVKIHEIREASVVLINDDFAKGLGMSSLKDLKKAISDQISNEHSLASRSKMKKSLLDILDEKHNFELPEGMLEQEYNSVCTSLNKDSNDTKGRHDHNHEHTDEDKHKPDEKMSKEEKIDARNIAHRRVKLGLLMGEIGRTNNLDITDEEINQAVMKEAQKYPGQEKQVLDYFKNNKEASQNLAGPLFEEKVFDFICEMADLKEKKVSVEELYNDQDVDQKPKKHKKSSTVKPKSKK